MKKMKYITDVKFYYNGKSQLFRVHVCNYSTFFVVNFVASDGSVINVTVHERPSKNDYDNITAAMQHLNKN